MFDSGINQEINYHGVLHECVKVMYRAPRSYNILRAANELSIMWPPSTPTRDATLPSLKAFSMSANKLQFTDFIP